MKKLQTDERGKISKFFKRVIKALPRAINLSVKSFIVAPPAVIFFGMMIGANFDTHSVGATLLQTTKDDIGHLLAGGC